MIFLGIDPGYGRMGYGIVEQSGNRLKALDWGVLETSKDDAMESRLEQVYEKVLHLAGGRSKPVEAGVETLFFSKNVKTAMAVAQSRGVILLALKKKNVPVVDISPQHVKTALVGNGAATKRQVQQMVKRLLNLDEIPKPDDAADGLGVALAAIRTRARRLLEQTVIESRSKKK